HGLPKDKTERNPIVEIAARLPIVSKVLLWLFDVKPRITPELIDQSLKALVDPDYTNISYKVLNIGAANDLPAYSMEIAIPMRGDGPVEAVELVMAVAAERMLAGEIYHTSPVSLRFVRQSPAHMSMMYGADTMTIELIMLVGTEGGDELEGAHEEALRAVGGRPHWGQLNYLTGSRDLVRAMYPGYDAWMRVRAALDPQGVFSSPFTKRVGISEQGFRI
ncbi:MAG: D-arabinono-1,4-lactone oxidase, partial [Steroidobacteraceae bacterium]